MRDPSPATVLAAAPADLDPVARIHIESFPDHTKSLLGRATCRRYLEAVVADPHHLLLVERGGGEVRGFAILQLRADSAVSRRWILRAWPSILLACLLRPRALVRAFRRRLSRRGRAPAGGDGSSDPAPCAAAPAEGVRPDRGDIAYLHLIAVSVAARGRGVAGSLLDECLRRASGAGRRFLYLTVERENASALRLYRRAGFETVPMRTQRETVVLGRKI